MQKITKVTVDQLFFCDGILKASVARCSTFQGNYMTDRNLELVEQALRPIRKRMAEEPMRWHFHSQIQEGQKEPTKKNEPTEEQVAEGKAAFEACLLETVDFEPYRVAADKIGDGLRTLSPKRETLPEEKVRELEEDFYVAIRFLGILKDGEENENGS